LQAAVETMLAKDPARRYQTPERAAQALEALASASGGDPAATTPIPAAATPPGEIPVGKLVGVAGRSATRPKEKERPAAPEPDVERGALPRRRSYPRSLNDLDRRDLLMLVGGGILTVIALLLGWLLYRLAAPKPAGPSRNRVPLEGDVGKNDEE